MFVRWNLRTVKKKPKVDMSAAAVTARLKLACGLGDIERIATRIRSLIAQIRSEQAIPELPVWLSK
jgi:hypothetical protein